jgi:hypothetical protein
MSHEGIGVMEGSGPHGKKVTFWRFLRNYINIRSRGINVQQRTVLDMSRHIWIYDDFLGDVLGDLWNAFTSGSGTGAIVSGVNGIVQLDDTALEDDSGLDMGAFYNFDPTLNCAMGFRLKTDTKTNLNLKAGFYKDADEYAWFKIDDADDNIDCAASLNGGAGAVDQDSGVDIADGTYITFFIECLDDGSVKFYINHTLVYTAPASTLSTSAGVLHKPYILVADASGQTTRHYVDIDYIFLYQDRT